MVVSDQMEIRNNPGIKSAQIMRVLGQRIFILDNVFDGSGSGVVHVFTKGESWVDYETTIDSKTFPSPTAAKINDFELLTLQDSSNDFFIATFGSIGLVHFTFDSVNGKFKPMNPTISDLSSYKNISNYQGDNSRFLQIEVYAYTEDETTLALISFMTFSNGNHEKVTLTFTKTDIGYTLQSPVLESLYATYGTSRVINWAQILPYQDHGENLFVVGYEGSSTTKRCSFGLYDAQNDSAVSAREMRGAVEIPLSDYLSNNMAAILIRDSTSLKMVVSVASDGQGMASVYNLSSKVSFVYKYDKPENFTNITLIAQNSFGSSSRNIEVSFHHDPSRPSGLAWYMILLIVLGALLVVGLSVFLVVRYRKKKAESKSSLLSTIKHESD